MVAPSEFHHGFLRIAFFLQVSAGLFLAAPVFAANLFIINNSDGQGVSGGLLATPPGTCTAVPGGATGDCSLRASAAVTDWAQGHYNGSRWSDAEEATLPSGTNLIALDGTAVPITSGDLPNLISTKLGASWIPEVCNRPWCGNLLRGDVISHLDENGDGVWDDTWIDSNFNGIRDNGEVDRTRSEQFAWGITSVMRELADLSLVPGNVSPPGISRMRVRLALGDASQDPDARCDGDMANPDCHNSVVTPPDLTGLTATAIDDDPAVFGKCDPDRPEFTALAATDPVRAQRALDNCLWFFASFPVTAPSPGDLDPLHNQLDPRLRSEGLDPISDPFAVRATWIDQRVVKYIASSADGDQNFSQNWLIAYGFDAAPDSDDINQGVYQNEWRLTQSDTGADTYPYNFLIQHLADARRRGFTQDPSVPVPECVPPLVGPTCDGHTNPTVDPFWGKAIVRLPDGTPVLNPDGTLQLDFDKRVEWFEGQACDKACRESGVGAEREFRFLFEQEVQGYLLSCLNCGHPASLVQETVTYQFAWPGLPAIAPLPHPPALTTIVPVLP